MQYTKLLEIDSVEIVYFHLIKYKYFPEFKQRHKSLKVIFEESTGEILKIYSSAGQNKRYRNDSKELDISKFHPMQLRYIYEDLYLCLYRNNEYRENNSISKEVMEYLLETDQISLGYYKQQLGLN